MVIICSALREVQRNIPGSVVPLHFFFFSIFFSMSLGLQLLATLTPYGSACNAAYVRLVPYTRGGVSKHFPGLRAISR